MIGFFLRMALRMLVFAAVVYGTFFVPLGQRTLFGHMTRIAATAEAHEFFGAVGDAAKDASKAVASRVDGLRGAVKR